MNTVFSGTWNVKRSHVCYDFVKVLRSALCQDNAFHDNLFLASLGNSSVTESTQRWFKVTMWPERFLCLSSTLPNQFEPWCHIPALSATLILQSPREKLNCSYISQVQLTVTLIGDLIYASFMQLENEACNLCSATDNQM